MKTYKILAVAALALFATSCDDFLTVNPESYIEPGVFYTNETEVEIGLAGIYGCLARENVFAHPHFVMDSGTDEGYYNRRGNENWTVGLYTYTPSDNYLKNYWTSVYQAINLSNLFIENLSKSAFSEEEYNRYLAEARFMRGFSHMLLTFWWDEIPLRDESSKDQSSNIKAASPLPEVYDFIAKDLQFAADWLYHAKDANYVPGRANKMAAHALLARLYLRQAGEPLKDQSAYALAAEQCDIIINQDGWHKLNETSGNGYRAHFLSYIKCEYDKEESLFEMSFRYLRNMGLITDGRVGALNGPRFWMDGGNAGPSGYAMLNASPLVTNTYAPEDLRKAWNVPGMAYEGGNASRQTLLGSYYCPGKYRRWEPANDADLDTAKPANADEPYVVLEVTNAVSPNFTSVNWPIMRFSDVLLMYAEALNAGTATPSQAAIDALNRVRLRAGLGKIEDDKPSAVASKEAFFNELVDERMRELCFEGLRWNDLRRWGLTKTRLDKMAAEIRGTTGFTDTNEQSVSYLRSSKNFNPTKHLNIPYPLQEVTINTALKQKVQWTSAED